MFESLNYLVEASFFIDVYEINIYLKMLNSFNVEQVT